MLTGAAVTTNPNRIVVAAASRVWNPTRFAAASTVAQASGDNKVKETPAPARRSGRC
jgi:hypothetical protein